MKRPKKKLIKLFASIVGSNYICDKNHHYEKNQPISFFAYYSICIPT